MMSNSFYGKQNGPQSGQNNGPPNCPPPFQQPNQNYYQQSWPGIGQGQNQVGWGWGTNQVQQMQPSFNKPPPPPMQPPPAVGQQYHTSQHPQTSQCNYRPPLMHPPHGNMGGYNNGPNYHQVGNSGDWYPGGNYPPSYNQGPPQNRGKKRFGNPNDRGFNSGYNNQNNWSDYDRFPPGFDDGYGDMSRYYNEFDDSYEYNENERQPQLSRRKRGKWKKKVKGIKDQINKPNPPKRDIPENSKFFCDTCDVGFSEELNYKDHVNNHEKCSYEGCCYIAAPRKIQLHIKLQHTTGLAKKIWSLESQEDIEKWKLERKKNFPTAEIIEQKKRLEEEKKARGEVIETPYFGKMKGKNVNKPETNWPNGWPPLSKSQRKKQRRNKWQEEKQWTEKPRDTKSETEAPMKKPKPEDKPYVTEEVKRLMKIRKNAQRTAFKTGKAEDMSRFKIIRAQIRRLMNQNREELGLLSNRKMRFEARKAAEEASTINNDSQDQSSACNDENKGKETTKDVIEEIEIIEEQITNVLVNDPETEERPRFKDKRAENTRRQGWFKRPPSLLEKLLANEKRHERNVILQCVHHIVKNNFFGIGQPTYDSQDVDMIEQSSNKSVSSERSDLVNVDSVSIEDRNQNLLEDLESSENIDEQCGDNVGEQSGENMNELSVENIVVTRFFDNSKSNELADDSNE